MSSLPALAIWLEIYQMERCSGRLHWQVGYSILCWQKLHFTGQQLKASLPLKGPLHLLLRRLLHTNGASNSRLTSSTVRICFQIFRTVPKHMLMQNWQKLYFTVASWLALWGGPLHLPLQRLLQCQFGDGGGLSTPPSWDTKLWCTESSWNLQTENRGEWRSPTLSQKLVETRTYTKLKISTPFLQA